MKKICVIDYDSGNIKSVYNALKNVLVGSKSSIVVSSKKEDIKKAEILDADYIFLSPVNKTSSHQNQKPMGWKKFSELTLH